MPLAELTESLYQQLGLMLAIAKKLNIAVNHIKFHGALYNDVEANPELAMQLAQFLQQTYPA